jgi:hypothetical protein
LSAPFEKPRPEILPELAAPLLDPPAIEEQNRPVAAPANGDRPNANEASTTQPEVGGKTGPVRKPAIATPPAPPPWKRNESQETIPRNPLGGSLSNRRAASPAENRTASLAEDGTALQAEDVSKKLVPEDSNERAEEMSGENGASAEDSFEATAASYRLAPLCRPVNGYENVGTSSHSRDPVQIKQIEPSDHSREPMEIKEAESSPPPVQVTIGRVEVRAILPEVRAPRQSRPAAPKLSVSHYLKHPRGGGA